MQRVIVVGGGHAGVEAAAAAARIGTKVLLVTHNIDTVGQMSCNPAIGGIGKGHLVREIDALDGIMARCADKAGIHYRILNMSKGSAVRATRAQTDRTLYRTAVRSMVEANPLIELLQDEVIGLEIKNNRIHGAELRYHGTVTCSSLVLTAGTFLAARMHTGEQNSAGGRAGAPPTTKLAEFLSDFGMPVGRLKTGTPPRLDGRTIDFSILEKQPSMQPLTSLSLLGTTGERPEQVDCHLTATSEQSHDIVRENLALSPVNSGAINSPGPRYCPSIEDKVVRFSERKSHQIFLEPEGLTTTEIYPNGISTALPAQAQVKLVQSIKGLENVKITRLGYAVEYDYYDPRALEPNFAVPEVDGLYFAGQINGTTGYEEAAAQGLLAGANAALQIMGQEPWWPGRDSAYLGVLCDDLTTQGVTEPYRMFTSRAEFRLRLREDNADFRLTQIGRKLGLVKDQRWESFQKVKQNVDDEMKRLNRVQINEGGDKHSAATKWLRRPEVGYSDLDSAVEELKGTRVAAEIEARCKYSGLIDRQNASVARQKELTNFKLPRNLKFSEVHGLSNEAIEKLDNLRPVTLGQASRISGITPSAISMLRIHLDKRRRA